MNPRMRKLIGTVALLAFLIVYVLIAMAVAIVMQVNQSYGAATLAYYIVTGLLWVIPAGVIIQWMQKSPAV
jgi:peptidoglycan/LPS O-acetylase OafA/YrhL